MAVEHGRIAGCIPDPSDAALTRPLLLNGLLDVPVNFHIVTEWHPVDNSKARKEIANRRRHHHNSKTSFVSNLQDHQNAGPRDELVDDSKEAAVAELGNALTVLSMEGNNFDEFTLSVVIHDEDHARVEHAVEEFQKLFTQHDGLLYEEHYNLLNAFFATISGNRQLSCGRSIPTMPPCRSYLPLMPVPRGIRIWRRNTSSLLNRRMARLTT
ncbi:hypothetical protein ACOBR2_15720 [Telmatobacter bradus]|uniref:hypothetical protein n=1 Tax=Telmatobacter bradus TaxID=474953 RepID=UPI003B437694